MGLFNDLTGKTFGRLTVTRRDVSHVGHVKYICKCSCGETISTSAQSLTRGDSKSCGCLQKELARVLFTVHGMLKSTEYFAWTNMKNRCTNPKASSYSSNGAHGIKVCQRWMESFINFYEDMCPKPEEHYRLKRHDIDKDYNKDNCYWGTNMKNRNKYKTIIMPPKI